MSREVRFKSVVRKMLVVVVMVVMIIVVVPVTVMPMMMVVVVVMVIIARVGQRRGRSKGAQREERRYKHLHVILLGCRQWGRSHMLFER
jgi:ABC-type transport system involved in cytochrome bd biosynthesis fused ATPase/permease subunit